MFLLYIYIYIYIYAYIYIKSFISETLRFSDVTIKCIAYFGGNAPSKVYERDTVKKFRKAEHEVYL